MVLSFGEPINGRFGAGIVPQRMARETRWCPRNMVLGNDGVCYSRRELRKSDRMWIPGRKPLLTGGDLSAIARAARAATRVKATSKRLQSLGLLPKPNRGRPRGRVAHVDSRPHVHLGE
jgi:hypothetical protein